VSLNPQAPTPHEVMVVRRSPADQEEGHGGVWKLAYADFMTALMAFFLVMWLVNATDEMTLAQIANYFNPLKLSGLHSRPKGLNDAQSGGKGSEDVLGNSEISLSEGISDARQKPDITIDKEMRAREERNATRGQGPLEISRREGGGDAIRDPFDPAYRWSGFEDVKGPAVSKAGHDPHSSSMRSRETASEAENPGATRLSEEASPRWADGEASRLDTPMSPKSEVEAMVASITQSITDQAASIARDIEGLRTKAASLKGPQIDVSPVAEGVLIRLADQQDYEMFGIASALPSPDLVALLGSIAEILETHPGSIVVRGHTDGRAYKGGKYDNWRLSSSRAYEAYNLLIRGGIAENRFERIEGRADRDLRVPNNPGAALNRRVEILLRSEGL
jgi:chemotaxis protein MotB